MGIYCSRKARYQKDKKQCFRSESLNQSCAKHPPPKKKRVRDGDFEAAYLIRTDIAHLNKSFIQVVTAYYAYNFLRNFNWEKK